MAGWFVGRVMDKLFNAGFDYLQDQFFRWRTGMQEELDRLRVNHPMIQAVVSAYTQGNITDPNINCWLWQLRDAIDEANDVLDDFEYMELEKQLKLNMEETKVPSSFNSLVLEPARKRLKGCERALEINPYFENLEKAVRKLDRVSAQVNIFLHLVEKKEKEHEVKNQQFFDDRASGSFPGPVFIGRDQQKQIVMQWLRKPSNHNLSLLSVVGHGGMGKTTLLQNIFADEITKEFDLKIWVCVSHNFEVEKVITDMLKYLDEWSSHLTMLAPLQERLNSVTQSRKFLLVLDDIWEENTTKWEKVISPLANGNLGSKILVTTRIDAAASMFPDMIIKNKETLTLKGLEEAQCLELLKTHAFTGMENFSEHKKLMSIAEEIVKKLSGSPLATKVIGGVLKYDLTPEHWERILNSDIGRVELVPGLNTNPIMPILRISFTYLPQPLQNCFAFCSIFPQDHRFDKVDLVRMWIALGFIQESSIEGETLEDIGGRYFDILVRQSFFDKFEYYKGINYKRIYYKMHDLLLDLALSISSGECFRFMEDNVSSFRIPNTIRHLFVKTKNLEELRKIKDVKNLHSLFLTSTTGAQCFTEILTEIFEASRSIRLLFIASPYQEEMPEAIKNLRHLRYLNFTGHLTRMPRSLSSLYHLQFIIYKGGVWGKCSLDFFPGDVSNISKLRHLELPKNTFPIVPEIGKFRSLQELNEFNVENKNGWRIKELEDLSELRKLRIHLLENVMDVREARKAKLCEKRKLTYLFLNWGDTVDEQESYMGIGSLRSIVNSDLDVNVLENLKPYRNLKRLSIVSYKGVRSAEWMYNADLISNLEYISLNGCSEWETLPPFGQLRYLKSLYLYKMPKAKRLDYKFRGNNEVSVFPSLEVLNMEGLEVLEDWFDGAGAAAYDLFFPCLTELVLYNCPNLQELPYLPHKLKKMRIYKIGWKVLNFKIDTSNCGGTLKYIPLETLEVRSCPNITSLPLTDVAKLRIEGCPNLMSLGGPQKVESGAEKSQPSLPSSLERLPSVELLHIPASLEELHLENLKLLQCLPSSLSAISSLKQLVFKKIPLLESLPELPSSLYSLSLYNLDKLQSLPLTLWNISSLKLLVLESIPLLKFLPNLPCTLDSLSLKSLDNLQWLPSLSPISSLKDLTLHSIPLKSLPELPPLLPRLYIDSLNIQCLPSSLSAMPSLKELVLKRIPLKSLPDLPSSLRSLSLSKLDNLEFLPSLSAISSLNHLYLVNIPLLNSLPELPSSLDSLSLCSLDKQCLPSSLSAISSLNRLQLRSIPLLESLPELPSSLESLSLSRLDTLQCLPSFSAFSSLNTLSLYSIQRLKSLPDLPFSLFSIEVRNCHPELMKRYKKNSGSDWQKVAHIRHVNIY